MESEVPTPLETDVEVKSDLVTAPRGCESCATLARYGILLCLWPAGADHRELGFRNRHALAVAETKESVVRGHHSAIV